MAPTTKIIWLGKEGWLMPSLQAKVFDHAQRTKMITKYLI